MVFSKRESMDCKRRVVLPIWRGPFRRRALPGMGVLSQDFM